MGWSTTALRMLVPLRPALGRYAGHQGPALAQLRGRPPSTTKTSMLGGDLEHGAALPRATATGGGSQWHRVRFDDPTGQ
jgi:hypothetical protein